MTHPVKELFQLWFDEPRLNTAAKIIAGRLIKDYGYETVKEAFLEAASKEKYTLAYVKGILQNQEAAAKIARQKAAAEKNRQEAELLRSEDLQTGLGLSEIISKLKSNEKPHENKPYYKTSDEYKKKKQNFENEILKKGRKD